MGYSFDGTFRPLKEYQFISSTLTGNNNEKNISAKVGNRFKTSWIGRLPVPFPKEFVQGIDTQKYDFEQGIESYVNGTFSNRGWWWYYGYVLLLKEPLGVWALTILTLVGSCFVKGFNADFRDGATLLVPFAATFFFISSQDGFSLHPRYDVLVLPFLYLLISKSGRLFEKKNWTLILPTVIALAWIVISSLSFYPHSMSYFNELAGGPRNWPKHLLGSNIDHGQDLYDLQYWHQRHPEAKPLFITHISPIPLEKLGVERDGEVPEIPTAGWMLIGVNELHGNTRKYDWLKKQEPEEMIGYSIWVYRLDLSEIENSQNQ